ncbi:MAG: chorismate mutase [Actinomycetes bacterium]
MTWIKQVRGVRGATTIERDTREDVVERVTELLSSMCHRNGLSETDIVSILFTATDDVHSVFPATAARDFGFAEVPLMCARELDITGATPLCIRILVTARTRRRQSEVTHVYLHGATNLRSDLAK